MVSLITVKTSETQPDAPGAASSHIVTAGDEELFIACMRCTACWLLHLPSCTYQAVLTKQDASDREIFVFGRLADDGAVPGRQSRLRALAAVEFQLLGLLVRLVGM